jgi:DNA-binding transcriptional LysR family regulator
VHQRLIAGTLATVEVPIRLPTLELFLFWHHSRNRDPAHRWFIQLLDEITAEI